MTAWMRGGVAVLVGVIFMVALGLSNPEGPTVLVVSNAGQLAAAVVAAAACARAACRAVAGERLAWGFLAVGTGSWAAGQMVWTYYEVVLGVEVPFPSKADVGFLLFPLFATAGLLSLPGAAERSLGRGRDLLDGAIVACSLLVLSWSTTLGSVVESGGDGALSTALSIAYPLGDVVLATVAFLMIARVGSGRRATLLLVAGGVGGLALSDSAYVYLVALDRYSSGDLVTSGWVFGFLLIAAGGTMPVQSASRPVSAGYHRTTAQLGHAPSRLKMVLPYIPLSAAGVSVSVRLVTAPVTPIFDLSLGMVLVILVLARQYLAMNENLMLLTELEIAKDRLQHQALHDPLTGLPNRALFADRVEHALAQRSVDVGLLYCDLDDFKTVNDELGHLAGDTFLRIVAARLLECVRPGDTVARLGGDEFAVLLSDSEGAAEVADRVLASIHQPVQLGNTAVRRTVSVGIAYLKTAEGGGGAPSNLQVKEGAQADADNLIRRADSAMYTAKAAGKDQAVRARLAPGQDTHVVEPARS